MPKEVKFTFELENGKEITKAEWRGIRYVVDMIRNVPGQTGNQLTALTGIKGPTARKYIGIVRENPAKFLRPGEYLIAQTRGYYITTNKKKINAFLEKTHNWAKAKIRQVHEGWKVTGKVEADGMLLPEEDENAEFKT